MRGWGRGGRVGGRGRRGGWGGGRWRDGEEREWRVGGEGR